MTGGQIAALVALAGAALAVIGFFASDKWMPPEIGFLMVVGGALVAIGGLVSLIAVTFIGT